MFWLRNEKTSFKLHTYIEACKTNSPLSTKLKHTLWHFSPFLLKIEHVISCESSAGRVSTWYIKANLFLKVCTHFEMSSVAFFVVFLGLKHYFFQKKTNESQHEISNNVVCATSKASDQIVHIRAFASRLNNFRVLSYMYWPNIFGVSKLKRRLYRLFWVYMCQNVTLL